MKPLRIALTKGRLEKSTVELFEQIGLDCSCLRDRRWSVERGGWGCVGVGGLAKAPGVLTDVVHGVWVLGVVGKDTIMEHGSHFFEILDLGFGRCGFALAAPRGVDFYSGYREKTVASKYPNVARRFFESKKMDVRIIRIEGSVELAPLLGLSDGIVDIVETGVTLRENGLEVVERIAEVSARLIVNSASLKLRKREIEALAARLEAAIKGGN